MIQSSILSGKEVSESVYSSLRSRIFSLSSCGITPGLAVVLVGNNPASQVYVKSKTRTFEKLNLYTKTIKLESEVSEKKLLELICEINDDEKFHGILVQLPLPNHINADKVINAINPKKDVDGFHPENAGLLTIGSPRFIPCTPKGIMRMFQHYNIKLNKKHIVVIGRSNIVGRPISILTSLKFDGSNGTTTICHSGTSDIQSYTLNADVIIAALGIPKFLKGNMIKKNAIVVDVGINRVDDNSKKGYSLVGDIDWDEINGKASFVSPVPGGVGPMTIAMLVENTVEACEQAK